MSICDGVVPDGTVGDGLYAVATLPDEVGPYDVMATLTGRTPSGVDVTRQATVTFTVVKPSLALLGTVTTRTVDSNFNGLIDELILDINADVLREGDFLVQATLSAASGTSVLGETRLTLPIGNTVIPVTFTAEKILSLGVDGPYRIGPVEVVFLPPGGAELADRLEQAGEAPAFLLTQFEQPLIQFAGTFSDAGVDLDGNGLFNRLDVQLDMVFRTDGFYQWSAILFDSTGRQIDFSASSGFKPTGVAPIELSFDGERIGANGIDGPFLIRNLLVNGAGGSLLLQMVAETSPFQAREFEGFVENKPPVAQCQNVTVPTDLGLCPANASVDAGSFDPEGSPITLKQTPPGPYGPGLTNVTLTVTDNQQSSDACTATVTVVASASCEEPELLNNELSAKVKPGTSVYNPTPVPDGPAGTFSFTAEFCNIGTKQLTTLKSVTTTLTAGHVLLNRDSGTPPAVGSEVTFSANGGYSDLNLGPNECVDVHYQIGLAVQASGVLCRCRRRCFNPAPLERRATGGTET